MALAEPAAQACSGRLPSSGAVTPPVGESQCGCTTLNHTRPGALVNSPSLTVYAKTSGPFRVPALKVTIGEPAKFVTVPLVGVGVGRMENVKIFPAGPVPGRTRFVVELSHTGPQKSAATGPI